MTTSTESLPALLRETALSSMALVSLPDNLEDTTSSAYSHLLGFTSQSLHALREQPAALQTSRDSLELQLSTLCSRHVHSFVRVRTATAALPNTMDKLDEQLETLIERDLPALSNASQSFSQEVAGTIAAKERARNLLEQYDLSIKDLLDIPRLLMTCARASHPIEALQLGIHMARIVEAERRSNNSTKRTLLLAALKEECWAHLLRLRSDLLRDLGARGVRLPAARRYVSLLSRLEQVDDAGYTAGAGEGSARIALSPSTICLSFLQSRWAVVEEIGAHETDDDLTTQTYSQISTWRDVVGESCNIALALFSDGKPSRARPDDEVTPISLISSFASLCLGKLEELIKRQLPRIGLSTSSLHDAFESLDTLHTQMAYAASSLSRQGLDFSQVSECAALFEQQALLYWSQGLAKVKERFSNVLQPRLPDLSSIFGTSELHPFLQHPLTEDSHSPWSEQAARFLLLARLSNDLLDTYEALLIFAPLSIGQEAQSIFDEALQQLVSDLSSFLRRMENDKTGPVSQLHLPSITLNQTAETDAARLHQAILAVCARFASAMCRSVLPSIRMFVADAFQTQQSASTAFDHVVEEVMAWSVRIDEEWHSSEQTRVKQAEEENRRQIAQEEERKRFEEQQRVKEEEESRRRQEEQARIEAEETQQRAKEAALRAEEEERRRQQEAARRQEEDRVRKEAAEIERKRLAEEMERQREEEAARAAAAERAAHQQAELRKREEEERKERQLQEEKEAAVARKQAEEAEAARKVEEDKAAAARKLEEERAAARIQADQEKAAAASAERKSREEEQAAAQKQKQREEEELQKQREVAEMEVQARLQREQDLARKREEESKKSDVVEQAINEEQSIATRAPVAEIAPQPQEEEGKKPSSQEADAALKAEEPPEPATSTAESTDHPSPTQAEQMPPVIKTQPKPANKLAEKLRKRQEERERAAAAAKAKAEKGD